MFEICPLEYSLILNHRGDAVSRKVIVFRAGLKYAACVGNQASRKYVHEIDTSFQEYPYPRHRFHIWNLKFDADSPVQSIQ